MSTVICDRGKTHCDRSRGDTPWGASREAQSFQTSLIIPQKRTTQSQTREGQHHRLMTLGHCRNCALRPKTFRQTRGESGDGRHLVRFWLLRLLQSARFLLAADWRFRRADSETESSPRVIHSIESFIRPPSPVPGRSSDAQRPHKTASGWELFCAARDTHIHRC